MGRRDRRTNKRGSSRVQFHDLANAEGVSVGSTDNSSTLKSEKSVARNVAIVRYLFDYVAAAHQLTSLMPILKAGTSFPLNDPAAARSQPSCEFLNAGDGVACSENVDTCRQKQKKVPHVSAGGQP